MLLHNHLINCTILLLIINEVFGLSFNQPKLCPHAVWEVNAVTVANSTLLGSSTVGMFVDTQNTLFVNDHQNGRVWKLPEGTDTPIAINSSGSYFSAGIFVTNNGDIYLDNGRRNGRVDKWSSVSNTIVPVMYVSKSCHALFVDINDTLYCALNEEHRIVKRLLREGINSTTTAAGNGNCAKTSHQLCHPTAIFVDDKLDLYVADHMNYRIQYFKHGQMSATTLVGSEVEASLTLHFPISMIFAADGDLFIVERGKHSILRLVSGELHCVAACSGSSGQQQDQFNGPYSISFDTRGNIFVLDEYNRRIQKFALARNSCVSYNQPKLCPDATWNASALTVAVKGTIGERPHGIFVDHTNTLYVAAHQQQKGIFRWSDASNSLQKVVYEAMPEYASLFVAINGDIYYTNLDHQGRIDRWNIRTNSSESVANFDNYCVGLFIDIYNTIYCSVHEKHGVMSAAMNDINSTLSTVAGTGSPGSSGSQLNNPHGIFVDIQLNLYVADTQNNRIQLFRAGGKDAKTVAGSEVPPGVTLSRPTDVALDAEGCLYIVEQDQNRVVRSGASGYGCIVGCSSGDSASQLNRPYSIRFDDAGNMYIADRDNHRIQKFLLASNSCAVQPSTTHSSTTGSLTTASSTAESVTTASTTTESTTTASFTTEFVMIASYSTKKEVQTSPVLTTTVQRSTVSSQPSDSTAVSEDKATLPSDIFNPKECENAAGIGPNCALSKAPCAMLNPCLNGASCFNNGTNEYGYFCSCPSGFNGTQCERDIRICKADTCFGNGNCTAVDDRTYVCSCNPGWTGDRCERKINHCHNVTCANNGVCRSTLLNYTCECLGDSYSGRHCEITATKVTIFKIVSKSFAYVAIIALVTAMMFIVIMDVLKYYFGIDPTRNDLERIRRKRRKQRRRPVVQRFVYVNTPATGQGVSTIAETVV